MIISETTFSMKGKNLYLEIKGNLELKGILENQIFLILTPGEGRNEKNFPSAQF